MAVGGFIVQFLQAYDEPGGGHVNAGEQRGYDQAYANYLVAQGIANAVNFSASATTGAQEAQQIQGGSASAEDEVDSADQGNQTLD